MTPVATQLEASIRLGVAALVGLGVGLEREWSGHTRGPNARFAGLRTFFLLGIVGGGAGLLLSMGYVSVATAAIAGGMGLGVAAYVATVRKPGTDSDGTTEAAALAVVMLGAIAGTGWLMLAAGAGSIVVLALREKTRLHWLVQRIGEKELHATLQFAVMALVILPLLPEGPFGGPLRIQPRMLWMIVLFFSALNFAGYLARRAVGPSAGYTLTGVIGGLLSSTAVTLDFSRASREEPQFGGPLAYGVIGACTVLIPRIIIITTVLNPQVAMRLCWLVWPPVVCGTVVLFLGWRREANPARVETDEPRNPLRLGAAMQMAVAFQVGMTAITLVHDRWGTMGVYPTAAALGLTDVDALAVSISRAAAAVPADVAARAIALGILANTFLKFSVATGLGVGRFRRVALAGLAALAVASGAGLLLRMPHAWG